MMKKSFIVIGVLLLALSLTIIIPACTNTDKPTNTETEVPADEPEPLSGQISATVNNNAWSTTQVSATYSDNGLIITATADDGSILTLEIGEDPEVGIFPIRKGKLQAASFVQTVPERTTFYAPFNRTTGTINISLIDDDKLEGSFSFTGSNVSKYVIVEGGSFVAPIKGSGI